MATLTPPPSPSLLIPPVWFVLAILAMVELHYAAPGWRWLEPPATWLGLMPAVLGVSLDLWALALFLRAKTGIRPFTPVTQLVVDGPYRFSRNPMYLGMALILTGLALFLGSATPWLVLPAFIAVINTLYIRREEAMLETLYGEECRTFKTRVRRWL